MSFNLIAVSLRNLKRKLFRTAILILSLGLLVSTLVFGASFIMSISSTISRASDRLGADLLIVPIGARDLAQEIFVRVYERLDQCRDAERFPGWMILCV